MIEIHVPGLKPYEITHVVVDYNGTIAVDGKIPMDLKPLLIKLKQLVPITVLTADTHGTAKAQCEPLGLTVRTFPQENAAACKKEMRQVLQGHEDEAANCGCTFPQCKAPDHGRSHHGT